MSTVGTATEYEWRSPDEVRGVKEGGAPTHKSTGSSKAAEATRVQKWLHGTPTRCTLALIHSQTEGSKLHPVRYSTQRFVELV